MPEDNNDRRQSVQSSIQEEHETPPLPEEGGHEDPIDEYAAHARQETIDRDSSREKNDRPNIERAVSTTSTQAPPVVKVPRKQRSGLLARWTLLYEAEEPKDYPRKTKWLITLWIAMAATTAPMGSSIILPALTDITREFGTTATITNLSVALYMLSMSVFPLWWSAFSEGAGRRTVYLVAFLLYTVFNVAAALSTNIGMFVAFRFLSGGSSASVQAVGAGTVADCWAVKERGRAMGIFYLGPLAGPLIAPIIGGALTQGLGWRSTQWFQVIYGAVLLVIILLFLPETHKLAPVGEKAEKEAVRDVAGEEKASGDQPASRPALSRTTSHVSVAAVKTRKLAAMARKLLLEPLLITRYLRFPAVALTVYYAAISFGCLYFLNISVEKTFSRPPYNFSVISVGLLYISNSFGYFVTSILGGRWVDKIMLREARKAGRFDDRGKPIFHPEDRMRENAWIGAIMMPISLLWYGWCADAGVYWFAPILANFFFGAGSMLIFSAATTMLTEFMPKKASNGVALNNFVRNIFAFLGTFLAEPLINAIGNGWLFTILAGICFASCPVIFVMKKNAVRWRETMDREMD